MIRFAPHVVALALLSACVSVGPKYDDAALGQLRPGMTRAEVEGLMGGPPKTSQTTVEGTQALTWTYGHSDTKGATLRTTTLLFGADGRFVKIMEDATAPVK